MSVRNEQRDRQFNFSFVDDPIARRVMRALFLLELGGMIAVVILSLGQMFLQALVVSFVSLVILGLALLWLYARYLEFPVIREKKELEHLTLKFEKGIQTEEMNIQAAVRQRGDLFQAEKAEIRSAIKLRQKNHIQRGLLDASLEDASIPAVGPELKSQLAGYGVTTAADIPEKIASLQEVAETQRQALIDWRASILTGLEDTKPLELEEKELQSIQGKYRTLQDRNNIANRKALASRQMLQYEVISFRERLQQIAAFTFVRYLSRSLTSRSAFAAPLTLALVMTQVVSSVSVVASSLTLLVPVTGGAIALTATPSAPTTVVPTATSTAAPSATTTFTSLPLTTTTSAASPTALPSPTSPSTQTPSALFPSAPSQTPIIPVSGGTGACDPSYPGVCIPPAPPDLDCKDISERRFQVLPPDPHSFDRDGDGIGCE